MAQYPYDLAAYDVGTLHTECVAAGLPVDTVRAASSGVVVHTSRDLTAPEKTTLDGVVAAHVPPTKDQRRRDAALALYDSPDSPDALMEKSAQYSLLDLINELQTRAGINPTGQAQLRNATREYIKPGGG